MTSNNTFALICALQQLQRKLFTYLVFLSLFNAVSELPVQISTVGVWRRICSQAATDTSKIQLAFFTFRRARAARRRPHRATRIPRAKRKTWNNWSSRRLWATWCQGNMWIGPVLRSSTTGRCGHDPPACNEREGPGAQIEVAQRVYLSFGFLRIQH